MAIALLSRRVWWALGLILSVGTAPLLAGTPSRARPVEAAVAARIDAELQRGIGLVPPLVDDEQFLRRASLDLTGKLPDPPTIRDFAGDRSPEKRARLIDRLVQSEDYAVNWGRYWRDVVTFHTPASGNYLRWQLFDRWWTEQMRRNRPWDEVVTALLTATGINDETPPVNYLTAMYGNPIEIAATTSRLFLGVQIQCAECHNAKTEPWKREQFHEFAAFFGRARIIQHKDVSGRGTPYAIEGRSTGQYRMTDKKDPSRLLDMQPRFLTGESVGLDAPDEERRAALARFITNPDNPWFARCYTNRMWTALMGWGFYPSVGDLGSGATPQHPKVLELLAREWTASGYDVRWLFRTIMLTQAYQRQLPTASASEIAQPAVCPVRLRPEQVYDALQKALGFDENDRSIPAPAPSSAPAVARHTGTRHMVYQTFKENPSLPFAEMHGTIPQALLMMNSALVAQHTAARGKTVLAELLGRELTDVQLITALYERTLARKPTSEEISVCLRYIRKVDQRSEALEDIHWSLVNTTEFLIKR